MSPDAGTAGAVLHIDLDALVENYRRLTDRLTSGRCAAVVKADAYGLGAARVAPALAAAGCDIFFVAHTDEGLALRRLMPNPEIYVLNGLPPGGEALFADEGLSPVLNSLTELDAWAAFARSRDPASPPLPPAALHVDTGMSRLGLPDDELATLEREPGRLVGVRLGYVISHLACADEPEHPLNREQLAAFMAARAALPACPASFANSSGIFLGPDYHFDLVRPGIALYGGNPTPGKPNPMAEVVRLQGRIVQVREIDSPRTVGYGAAHRVAGPTRIATVPVGYADGFLRALGNRACGYIGSIRVPVVGRVSMDLITLDVSAVPPADARPGRFVDLIGGPLDIDSLAALAGTISYELLTRLGGRLARVYEGGAA